MYEKDKILNSFPPYLAKDVRRVLDMLVMKNDDISSRYYIVNLGGLNIAIPERVYMREQTPSNMTAVQRNILDCIFTRHNNGFVRQRHLQNLISCTEYWTIPFCFKLLGEYVDNKLQSDKLFLYFIQFGKSAYSGKMIDLEKLMSGSKVYDIEHIYPQAYVKDDSIINNKVLVFSEENGAKQDIYPIKTEIRKQMSFTFYTGFPCETFDRGDPRSVGRRCGGRS